MNTFCRRRRRKEGNGAKKVVQFRRDRGTKSGGGRGEQVRGQRGRLSDVSQGVIRVDELARSIQARVSRNPDLLFAFRFVEWRSVGNCRRCRWKPLLLPDLSRVRTCIKHGDVTVRRHLTAAGGGLWKGLRSRLDGYFRCVFGTGGDVHFRRARTPMIIDCTFEHLPTTDR